MIIQQYMYSYDQTVFLEFSQKRCTPKRPFLYIRLTGGLLIIIENIVGSTRSIRNTLLSVINIILKNGT